MIAYNSICSIIAAITMYIRYEYWGFWLGLRQSDTYSDQWLWTDNQDVTYFNWAEGKPSETVSSLFIYSYTDQQNTSFNSTSA